MSYSANQPGEQVSIYDQVGGESGRIQGAHGGHGPGEPGRAPGQCAASRKGRAAGQDKGDGVIFAPALHGSSLVG